MSFPYQLIEPQRGTDLMTRLNTSLNSIPLSDTAIHHLVQMTADAPMIVYPFLLIWLYVSGTTPDDRTQRKHTALGIFMSVAVSFVLHFAVKPFVLKDRPEDTLKVWDGLILDHIPDISFPSGHAAVSASIAVACLIFGYRQKNNTLILRGWILTAISIIICVSRVAGGIHWPTDILAGRALAIISALIICLPAIHSRLSRRVYDPLIRLQRIILPFVK